MNSRPPAGQNVREYVERPNFKKIQAKRGFEEIYDQIREEITSGRLLSGDRLPPEREMAEMFGVSRQAVREALRGLEISGLLSLRVGVAGGAFVKYGDTDVFVRSFQDLAFLGQFGPNDLLEARILMMKDAVRLACERGTVEDFDALRADCLQLERVTSAGDWEERARLRVEFYRLLGRAAHNNVYSLLLDALTEIVGARLDAVSPIPREDLVSMRLKAVEFLYKRDAEGAIGVLTDLFYRLEEHIKAEEATSTPKPGPFAR